MLSWNNLATPSTEVFSIVSTKCAIFVILSYTTKILSYPHANSSFVMKSTNIYVQSFSSTAFGMSFPVGASVWFLFLWYISHSSMYFLTSLVTPGHQKFLVTNPVVFHCPLCPPTGMSWCSWITSALNFLSLGTYTFPSLSISLLGNHSEAITLKLMESPRS